MFAGVIFGIGNKIGNQSDDVIIQLVRELCVDVVGCGCACGMNPVGHIKMAAVSFCCENLLP